MERLLPSLTLLLATASTVTAAQSPGGAWSELHRWDGAAAWDLLGVSLAAVGDLDGDGVTELLIGADGASPGGLTAAGMAELRSGATGAILHQFDGAAPGDRFGAAVDGAGDVDGDGVPDLVIGAPMTYAPAAYRGSVFVYSGATYALIHRIDGHPVTAKALGSSVAGVGDIDGDGFDDILAGAPLAAGNQATTSPASPCCSRARPACASCASRDRGRSTAWAVPCARSATRTATACRTSSSVRRNPASSARTVARCSCSAAPPARN